MNQIAFDLGIFQIYWYAIILFIAFLIGIILIYSETKRFGINQEFVTNLLFWLIPISLIGARLYYVAFEWSYYSVNLSEIIKFWNGGLAIYGGIILGLLFIILYTRKYKFKTLRMLDIVVVSLLLGQAIGRWGNFINQEAYGMATTRSFLEGLKIIPTFVIDGMKIGGTYYQPCFYYESLWCLLGVIVLMIVRRLSKKIKLGGLTAIYLMWYSVGRIFIEKMRTDSLMIGNFKASELLSVILFVAGVILFFITARKQGDMMVNRYADKENVDEIFF